MPDTIIPLIPHFPLSYIHLKKCMVLLCTMQQMQWQLTAHSVT